MKSKIQQMPKVGITDRKFTFITNENILKLADTKITYEFLER